MGEAPVFAAAAFHPADTRHQDQCRVLIVGRAGMVQLSAAAGHQATVGGVEQDWSKCYLFWDWGGGDGDAVTDETRGGVRHRVRH